MKRAFNCEECSAQMFRYLQLCEHGNFALYGRVLCKALCKGIVLGNKHLQCSWNTHKAVKLTLLALTELGMGK